MATNEGQTVTALHDESAVCTNGKLDSVSTSGVVANIYLAKRMASAEREPITGVWGQSPQRGPGAEPLVGCLLYTSPSPRD